MYTALFFYGLGAAVVLEQLLVPVTVASVALLLYLLVGVVRASDPTRPAGGCR